MKNIFSTVLVSLLLLFVATAETNACWCRKDPEETNSPENFSRVVAQNFRESSLVFSGRVVERNGQYLKFEVEQVWKGKEQSEILFTSTNYLDSSKTGNREFFIDSCAYNFKVGESYLVYATTENGNYEVSKCGRTQLLSEADKDIRKLNAIKRYSKWLENDVLVAIPPAYAKASEQDSIMRICSQLFGAPVDTKHTLFEVNEFYVLRVRFDNRGKLEQLAVEPKYFFEESHPAWKEPDNFTNLTKVEYEKLLGRLDSVKPKGALRKPASGISVVTNMTAWHKAVYENAVLEWGEVADLRRGDNAPTEIRWLRLNYTEAKVIAGKAKVSGLRITVTGSKRTV